MRNSTEGFYMCYVKGGDAPKREHQTLKQAEHEAKRLAKLTQKPCYVLFSLKRIELNEFVVTELNEFLPF